jgi:hypothetical protein
MPDAFSIAHDQCAAGDDQGDSQCPGDAEVRPRAEDTEGIQYETRYKLGCYHEREGARYAGLPRGHRNGAHYHRPEHARGQRVDDRAARELRPGHEERDHKGAKARREPGNRDQASGSQAPLGGPGQARLDRHAHASQRGEDEGGSN